MVSRRWLRGQSDVMVSLSTPRPLTTLGASRSTGAFDEVRRVYGDFATALGGTVRPASWSGWRSTGQGKRWRRRVHDAPGREVTAFRQEGRRATVLDDGPRALLQATTCTRRR